MNPEQRIRIGRYFPSNQPEQAGDTAIARNIQRTLLTLYDEFGVRPVAFYETTYRTRGTMDFEIRRMEGFYTSILGNEIPVFIQYPVQDRLKPIKDTPFLEVESRANESSLFCLHMLPGRRQYHRVVVSRAYIPDPPIGGFTRNPGLIAQYYVPKKIQGRFLVVHDGRPEFRNVNLDAQYEAIVLLAGGAFFMDPRAETADEKTEFTGLAILKNGYTIAKDMFSQKPGNSPDTPNFDRVDPSDMHTAALNALRMAPGLRAMLLGESQSRPETRRGWIQRETHSSNATARKKRRKKREQTYEEAAYASSDAFVNRRKQFVSAGATLFTGNPDGEMFVLDLKKAAEESD